MLNPLIFSARAAEYGILISMVCCVGYFPFPDDAAHVSDCR